ncbi:MAG: hypothetical protein ACFFBX_10440 [Promethearchaeota archaeon]
MSRNKTILIFTLFLLVSTVVAMPRPVAAQDSKTIVITSAYGIGTKAVSNLTTWLEGLGHTVIDANGGINSSILAGADALIFGGPYGPIAGIDELNATNGAIVFAAIHSWWTSSGGKFLWVGSDGDYEGRNWIAFNSSKILEEAGSALRVEPADISETKTVWDDGIADYRVIVNVTAPNPVSQSLMAGVNASLFHGPTCLYGISGGSPVALETTNIPNVFPIGLTDPSALYEPDDPTVPGYAHTQGQAGPFVMIAGEMYLGPEDNSKVIASGSTPYGGYEPIWKDFYHGLTLTGSVLVKNAILWGLTVEAPIIGPDPILIMAIAGVVIVVIIIIVVIIFLRRRK